MTGDLSPFRSPTVQKKLAGRIAPGQLPHTHCTHKEEVLSFCQSPA